MKIPSADNICWIAIQAGRAQAGSSGFEVACYSDMGHGRFEGRNTDIYFLNLEEFIDEFDNFISDRKRTPRLNGTYDTFIAFTQRGGAVMCEFHLADAYSMRTPTRLYQGGEFEVEQEMLLEFLRGFKQQLAQQRL